jgi:hypothetical protein
MNELTVPDQAIGRSVSEIVVIGGRNHVPIPVACQMLGLKKRRVEELCAEIPPRLERVTSQSRVGISPKQPRTLITLESIQRELLHRAEEETTGALLVPPSEQSELVEAKVDMLQGLGEMLAALPDAIAAALRKTDDDYRWLPMQEAAERIGLPWRVMSTLARQGKLPALRVKRKWFVRFRDAKEFRV